MRNRVDVLRIAMPLASGLFLLGCAVRFLWPLVGPAAWFGSVACMPPVADFGVRQTGDMVESVFEIRNDGLREIKIEKVVGSCRCLHATAEKLVIAPGETVKLHSTLDLDGLHGSVKRQILVRTTHPRQRWLSLSVEGFAANVEDNSDPMTSVGTTSGRHGAGLAGAPAP